MSHRIFKINLFILLFVTVLFSVPCLVDAGASGDTTIIFTGSEVQLLFDGGFFLEGPAVADDGKVYFSDITFTSASEMQAGYIWWYDPSSGQTRVYRSPSGMANGIIFDQQGRMLVCEGADFGGRKVTRTDMSSGKSTIIAGLYQGKAFNSPNDLVIDTKGRIYFTDPRYSGHEMIEQPVQGVYRINRDQSIDRIIEDIPKPNGIIISPDQKTLYVASFDDNEQIPETESSQAKPVSNGVMAYDLHDDGRVTFRQVLVDISPKDGVDGMTIDNDGNLYLTLSPPAGIYIYSPEGKEMAFIPTPAPPTNVTFGRGESKNMLYITARSGLYAISVKKTGFSVVD